MTSFHLIQFTKPNGETLTMLLNKECAEDDVKNLEREKDDWSYYLAPGCTGIKNLGTIVMRGVTGSLDDQYFSSY